MSDWELAIRVFFIGFSGVFISLTLLMFFIMIMGAVLGAGKKK